MYNSQNIGLSLIIHAQSRAKWECDIERRQYADICLSAYYDDFCFLIGEVINQIISDSAQAQELKKYLDHHELIRQILDNSCQSFTSEPVITINPSNAGEAGVSDVDKDTYATYTKQLKSMLTNTDFYQVMAEMERLVEVLSDIAILPNWRNGNVCFDIVLPSLSYVVQRADDVTKCSRYYYQVGVYENTAVPNKINRYYCWADLGNGQYDWYECELNNGKEANARQITDDMGKPVRIPVFDRFPVIMFRNWLPISTFWYQGASSLVEKSVQVDLRATDANMAAAYNIPQLFTTGYPTSEKMIKSRTAHINIPIDDLANVQPTAEYKSPGEPVLQILDAVTKMIVDCAVEHGISKESIQGGVASSGYQLALGMFKTIQNNVKKQRLWISPLKDLISIAIQLYNQYGGMAQLPSDTKGLTILFTQPVFPEDRATKLANDALEISNGVTNRLGIMLRENPDLTYEDAKNIIIKLMQEEAELEAEKRKAMMDVLGDYSDTAVDKNKTDNANTEDDTTDNNRDNSNGL